jgi:hypothetical protein
MDLAWELEQLAHAAAPGVVLEGLGRLTAVSDVVDREDATVEALVRADGGHLVRLVKTVDGYDSCTCDAWEPGVSCHHVIAVRLRRLQLVAGLDDRRLTMWERRARALEHLEGAWDELATYWLETLERDGIAPSGTVLRDAGSVHGGIQVSRSLAGRTTSEQLSEFLSDLVADQGIEQDQPLSAATIGAADELANALWQPIDARHPEANVSSLFALAGAFRRTVGQWEDSLQVVYGLELMHGALGMLMATGHARPAELAGVLLQAELESADSAFPWIAITLERFGPDAPAIATEMRRLLTEERPPRCSDASCPSVPRIRAEIELARNDLPALLHALSDWSEAPYGEFLHRLPGTWSPRPALELLEAAHRAGRVRWAPETPLDIRPRTAREAIHQVHHEHRDHPRWGAVAVGDLVVALARDSRPSEARRVLCDHARHDPEPSHRPGFERIWATARLGEGMAEAAEEIFTPRTPA